MINQNTLKLLIGDFFILLAFALSPGIRGYSNWLFGDYLMIAVIAGYIIFLRHKRTQQPEPK